MKTENEKKEFPEPSGHQKKDDSVIPENDREWRENERFRQEVQKAFRSYNGDELKPERPLDLSFLPEEVAAMLRDADPDPMQEETKARNNPGTEQKTGFTTDQTGRRSVVRSGKSRRFSQWAAAILFCAVLTGGMTCWMNSQYAYAARFHLEKILYQLSGNYYVSDPEEDGSTDVIEIRIDDPQDLDRAARFMPELLTPESVPEDWQFAGLALSKNLWGEKHAVYNYTGSGSCSFCIEESFPAEEASLLSELPAGCQTVRRSGRDLYLCSDSVTGINKCCFVEDQVMVRVYGDLEEDQLSEVAEQMIPGKNT